MKVNATQKKTIKVELDDFTIREIVITQFCNVFALPKSAYIDGDNLRADRLDLSDLNLSGAPLSWWDDNVIREASEEDKAAVLVLKKLQQEL